VHLAVKSAMADDVTTQMCFDPEALRQRGIRPLLGKSTADKLFDAPAPAAPQLNVAGLHYFTFNELIATWKWHHQKLDGTAQRTWEDSEPARSYVHPEQRTA
jgi:hypothetical protein